MKNIILFSISLVLVLMTSCGQDSENTTSVVYDLPSTSSNGISGSLTISKNADNSATFFIKLDNTIQGFSYPTHLHFGDLSTENAGIAFLLTPTSGDTGTSETVVSLLSDDNPVTYDEIVQGQFSVKIHLGDGDEEKNIILAASNVGASYDLNASNSIAVCGSEKDGLN